MQVQLQAGGCLTRRDASGLNRPAQQRSPRQRLCLTSVQSTILFQCESKISLMKDLVNVLLTKKYHASFFGVKAIEAMKEL